MEVLNTFFSQNGMKNYILTHSKSKILQVHLASVHPKIEFVLELRAVKHNDSVFFSTQSWHTIVVHKSEICEALKQKNEKLIFVNDELKVYTEHICDKYAVFFLDIRGKRVKLVLQSFLNMMQFEQEIREEYQIQIKMINKTAKYLSKFMDYVLTQYTDTKGCNDIKENLERLSNYAELDI